VPVLLAIAFSGVDWWFFWRSSWGFRAPQRKDPEKQYNNPPLNKHGRNEGNKGNWPHRYPSYYGMRKTRSAFITRDTSANSESVLSKWLWFRN
jgi:hypothetical protein